MKNKKILLFLLSALFVLNSSSAVFAEETVQQEQVGGNSLEKIEGEAEARHVENYITIEDTSTGIIERIELENPEVDVVFRNGEAVITNTVDLGDIEIEVPKITSRATQTSANTVSGYKGEVKITYTADGTYASLTNVSGSWKRVSGSATLKNVGVTYGQSLGTNSRSKSTSFGSAFMIGTGFPRGKYGHKRNHFLGANIYGKIGTKNIRVTSNIYF